MVRILPSDCVVDELVLLTDFRLNIVSRCCYAILIFVFTRQISTVCCIGMNNGSSNQNNDQGKKGSRRTWSTEEEYALLNVLDDVVARGQRCDTGQFKPGTLNLIEVKLAKICPASGLKATPHIESKLKKWKKEYAMVCDMLKKSGSGWNDVNKCVKVDTDEAWLSYVQVHELICYLLMFELCFML